MAGEIGALNRMLIDTDATFDSGSFWAEFISESIVQNKSVLNTSGIRGTRSQASERNRWGNEAPSGTIEAEASRALLDQLLYAALGTAENSNVFDPAESIPDFYFLIDKGSDIALVSEAKVGSLTLTGEQSQIIRVSAAIEAESISWGQSWPGTPPAPDITRPYFFSDASNVTLLSVARQIFSFGLTIDNALSADQFANSLTRNELILPTDRIVTVELAVAANTTNKDLLAPGAIGGAQVQLVLTNADEASSVLTITLGRVTFNSASLVTNGKGQQLIQLTGQSRALGHAGATAKDITVTNAHA